MMDIKVTLSRVIIGHKNKKGSIKPPYINKACFLLSARNKTRIGFYGSNFFVQSAFLRL